MNGRRAKQLRQKARALTTQVGTWFKPIKHMLVHADGTFRRIYQGLKKR